MRVRRSPRVLWRAAGGYLVMCTADGACVEIGGSAASVWAALPDAPSEGISVQELVQHLVERSSAPPAEVEPVVREVLDVFERHGCVASAA